MGETIAQPKGRSTPVAVRYEDDLYTWVQEQIALLRAGRLADIDAENIAEELSVLARSEYSRLVSALRVLVMHMLKWDQQPEYRTPSWVYSIKEQRDRFADALHDNPGLRPRRDEALAKAYRQARRGAALETGLHETEFPKECPYDWDQLLERPFEVDAWARERK